MRKRRVLGAILAIMTAVCMFAGNLPYSPVEAANDSIYLENKLFYWKVDDGKPAPTIKIKTANVPISCTYTVPKTDEIPYDGAATDYFYDNHKGSKKSYGDTLVNAGVLKVEGLDVGEKLYHPSSVDPTNVSAYQYWGERVIHTNNNISYAEKDCENKPVYSYEADPSNGITGLPNLLTETGMLTYKVNYDGNAILVPKHSLTYYTNVQGENVEVTSDDNVKLQYAVEKSSVQADKINWILALNTITVRLTADYTYTRLVPMTEGNFTQRLYEGATTTPATNGVKIYNYGVDVDNLNDTSIPHYQDGGLHCYRDYRSFITSATDDITGKTFNVVSNCPVMAVKETIQYYMDVECYIVDTDMVKNDGKDKNVYLKDFLKNNEVREDFRFAKNKSSFSVKYKVGEGFTVKGISRNANLDWIKVTHDNEAIAGYDGELIEWWAGQSAVHHFSTPDSLNTDVQVDRYMDYGVTLHFMDANNPVKVVKVKIPKRSKAPTLNIKNKKGTYLLSGVKANKVGIRLSDLDGNYLDPKTILPTTWSKYFGSSYLMDGDSATSPFGNQSFYVYTGGETGKSKDIGILEMFNLSDNKNFTVFKGAFVEAQVMGTKTKAPSGINAIYINPQDVFNTSKSDKQESIILEEGYITISDADKNNIYEYCVPESGDVQGQWSTISSNKRVKAKGLTDKGTIYIRKGTKETNDKSFFLPSSYIVLKYNGQGAGVPDVYYMDDYYEKGGVTVNLVNDTNYPVKIGGVEVKSKETKLLGTGNNIVYRNYIYKDRLVTGLGTSATISVSAGSKTITLSGIDDTEIKLSALLQRLKEEYGNEWTTVYNTTGITNITVDIDGYAESLITKSDEEAYTKKITIDEKEYTYHPVHLLRHMLEG